MPSLHVTEHTVKTGSHTTFYLASGPEDGPLMIFVHGWPELSISWRHQLPAMAGNWCRALSRRICGGMGAPRCTPRIASTPRN